MDAFKNGKREIKFRYDLLDKDENKKATLDNILDAEISCNSLADIKKTARFTLKENKKINWLNDKIQPFVIFGDMEYSLGIYKLASPSRSKSSNIIKRTIEAYDTTLLLKQDKLGNRLFIPSGAKYIDFISNLIKSIGATKINIEYTPAIFVVDKEFEIGTDKLTVVNTLLKEINYNSIATDNNGYFVSKRYELPQYREVNHTYKDDELSVMYDSVIEELDMFNIPNKWVVVASNPDALPLTSIYINNNPMSPTSVQNLGGRIITEVIKIDNVLDQKTLDSIAEKTAYEAMNIYGYLDFETAIMPNHDVFNMLHVGYSDMDINSNYEEIEWSMQLKAGARMKHKARKVVSI